MATKSKFKKLEEKIEKKEGLSKESAAAIAASAGRKKYGEAGMVSREKAGIKKANKK